MKQNGLVLALAAAGLIFTTTPGAQQQAREYFDPVFEPGAFCGGNDGKQPALLKHLIMARTETAPFQPVPPKPALEQAPVLYKDLGKLTFPVMRTGSPLVRTGAYASIWFPRTLHVTRPVRSSSSRKAIFPPPSLKMRSR